MQSFIQRVAVITGAGSGIGRALAIRLSELGAHLALSDINAEGLEQTRELLSGDGHVTTHVFDVSDQAAFEQHVADVIAAHKRVDLVINNAGVALSETVENMTLDDFHWIMNINFWGVIFGCKLFLPHLQQRPEAAIVNISSLFGCVSIPTQSAYNASKFAVRGFTEAFRQEMSDSNVFVTCVHPGGIKTNIVRNGKMLTSVNGELSHDEQVAEFDNTAMTTPEKAAEIILNGIRKRKRRIMVGADAHILEFIQRLLPVSYTRLFHWAIQKFD